jgi:hypothetical protein
MSAEASIYDDLADSSRGDVKNLQNNLVRRSGRSESGYKTYSGDDQQVIANHELAPLHETIYNSPRKESCTDDHKNP